MIGRVVFTIDDEPYEAVLDDEGNWMSSLPEIAEVFNSVFPADGSVYTTGGNPVDGRFGATAIQRAAEEFDGEFDLTEKTLEYEMVLR